MTARLIAALLIGTSACVPSFEDRPWRVEEGRVLAVSVSPPEARPGEVVSFDALVVDADGDRQDVVAWSFCTRPRTAGERTGVTDRCARGKSLETVTNPGVLLPDACARFGPNTPPTQGDEPAQRPADPDPSGGYHLPVGAQVNGTVPLLAFGFARVRCDLVGVTRAIFDDFEARYSSNANPVIESVLSDDEVVSAPLEVARGETIPFAVDLAATSFEPYVVYVAADGALESKAETLTVRWYVTGGELSAGTVTASPASHGASRIEWTAPETNGQVGAWVVVADDRGGIAWRGFLIDVR